MAGLGGQPELAPKICTYRAYFSLPETDPFSGDYEAVLDPYWVNPIWVQNGLVVSGKLVCLWAGEIRTVRANRRRQIRLAAKAGHGEGPR